MPRKPQIKNLKKTAERIKKAIKNKERIILYGDADLDGISSVVIMKETIQSLGGEVAVVFFPDRENDGYGITEKALSELKEFTPALLISFDLGIGNFKEIEIANKMGLEVLVIDHHQILDGLPKASIIIDPKQKDDKYPFKELATAGLTFKLAEEILKENFSENLKNSFLELAALATLADMMPIIEDNKIIVDKGLDSLRRTFRPGLKVFFEVLESDSLDNGNLQKIISVLNTCERIGFLNETYFLLTSSLEKARERVKNLFEKNQKKQIRTKEIIEEVERKIKSKTSDPIIFEGDQFWPLVLAGSVASAICQKYKKPVFIFKKGEIESTGSTRMPNGLNAVEAMSSCADLLITYGGHPSAAGFRLKNENLDKFKDCLINYFFKK